MTPYAELPCLCDPNPFQCADPCRCVGCGCHPRAVLIRELLMAARFLATMRGPWMGWADLCNLSNEATYAYWAALPVRNNVPVFPLSPIHRWDRIAALNRAARREAA